MPLPFSDRYSDEARLVPSLVLVITPVLTILGAYPPARALDSLAIVATAGAVAVVVLSRVVREWGKLAEIELYREWGGAPTTSLLRHRSAPNKEDLAKLHEAISAVTGCRLPDAAEEAGDPKVADKMYTAAVDILRERTRDGTKFPTVLAENATYGMWRNLRGARHWGRLLSASGIAIGLLSSWMGQISIADGVWVVLLNCVAFAFWHRLISSRRVQEAGERYAGALFLAALAMPAAQ